MITEEVAKELHNRATRGTALSATEQAELEAWYAQQDAEEGALLSGTATPRKLVALRNQVDEAVSQLLVVTARIQAQSAENDSIRQEIAQLQRQLAHRLAAPPA